MRRNFKLQFFDNLMIVKRNKNTAELVGLSFGDGGLTYRKNTNRLRFQLRGHLIEDKEHYDEYIIPVFNKEIMIPIFDRAVGIVFNKNKGFYGLAVESTKIEKELNYLGISSGVKKKLPIPDWIKDSKTYTKGFLRGFFDTDGSVSCQRNYSIKDNQFHTQIRIYLACCSKNLMEQIYNSLLSLNFKCIFVESKRQKWKDYYVVKLSGGIQVKRWFEIIGSKNPKQVTKYQIWKKFGFCSPYTTLKQRKETLKKGISPKYYYKRECRSGQTGQKGL